MFSNRKTQAQQSPLHLNPGNKKSGRSNYKQQGQQSDDPEEQQVKDIGDKMIESFSSEQLRCHYHPNKMITNFCEEQQCLLPMCPNCVSIHSDFHKTNKSQGQFRTLDLIIGQLLMQMEDQFSQVKQGQQQMKDFEQQVELQPDTIRHQFEVAKQKALQAVEDSFEKLRARMEDTLANYQNNNDNQISLLLSQLEQYGQTLEEIQEDLKDDPLPTIVKLKSENTLNRLLTQMPNSLPLVQQIQNSMIQITPEPSVIYNVISQNLNANLQIKNKEIQQSNQQTVKFNQHQQNNPKSQTYLQSNSFQVNNQSNLFDNPRLNNHINQNNNNINNNNSHNHSSLKNNFHPVQQHQPAPTHSSQPHNLQQASPNKFLNPSTNRSITPQKVIINNSHNYNDHNQNNSQQQFFQQPNRTQQFNPHQR